MAHDDGLHAAGIAAQRVGQPVVIPAAIVNVHFAVHVQHAAQPFARIQLLVEAFRIAEERAAEDAYGAQRRKDERARTPAPDDGG